MVLGREGTWGRRSTDSNKGTQMDQVLIGPSNEARAGPMTAEQREILRQIQGYIGYGIDNGLTFSTVLTGLSREIHSILHHTPGHLLNVAEFAKDLEAMANDPDIQREMR